ncbi:unnamed protein product [Prunus armeniaca]|uniref:Uncharacterized protein n=1 Tax=Prunus armeniaca TaxID=36596 RepID=A0A6J5TZD6_PRUAR|nr:unnamed protein product [Prunus armeniaca]
MGSGNGFLENDSHDSCSGRGKIAWPLAFTANGGVHFTTHGNWQHRKLELYDPKSDQVTDTGIKLGNYAGTRRRIYGYSVCLSMLCSPSVGKSSRSII